MFCLTLKSCIVYLLQLQLRHEETYRAIIYPTVRILFYPDYIPKLSLVVVLRWSYYGFSHTVHVICVYVVFMSSKLRETE